LRDDILQLVYAAIDEVNAQAVNGVAIEKAMDTPLLGGDRSVDSLTFVNLVIALEEQIQNTLGKSVVLVDEASMSLQDQPFRSVGSMAAYAEKLVSQSGG
jgi:acyl carrier protein